LSCDFHPFGFGRTNAARQNVVTVRLEQTSPSLRRGAVTRPDFSSTSDAGGA
jgi:hypothetical protein